MTIANRFYSLQQLRNKMTLIGQWAFVRWMRNQGVQFEVTYYVVFGRTVTK